MYLQWFFKRACEFQAFPYLYGIVKPTVGQLEVVKKNQS